MIRASQLYIEFLDVTLTTAHLSEKAFPRAASVEEPFPQERNKLLSLQTPAFDLI